MPRLLFIILCLSLFAFKHTASAQYFQQGVQYTIIASQDTSDNSITATTDITYTNNAPQKLDTIYLHLWANAFSDKLSAYSDQSIRMGKLDFYFAKENEMGGYQGLSVQLQGQKVTLYRWKGNPDVVYFLLPKSLLSGKSVNIQTSYQLKLPRKLSRMGFTTYDHYLTYWYPTPAVYDQQGWHPMPYLNMGEMYTEVADFEVQFETPVPSVIATVKPEPSSSANSLYYSADGVIDFAIITSTNKKTYKHKLKTKKGNLLDLHTMTRYPQRDSSAVRYIQAALDYFEPLIGDFPYRSLSIMDKGKKSNSGMEYPGLITVSGADDESGDYEYYLVHELLHQWFYSALAFNQRDHAWLDEGLTTYYQQRYYREVKGVDHYSEKGSLVMQEGQQPLFQSVARGQACRHYHLPIETDAMDLDPLNYGLNSYEIPARMFAYLEDYLGQSDFDQGIQDFYKKWRGKHPQPNDLKTSLEKVTSKELNWFFEELIKEDWSYDYSLESLKDGKLEVRHNSGSSPPYKITFLAKDDTKQEVWVSGHTGTQYIDVPAEKFNSPILDMEALSMDINRNNNYVNVRRSIKLIPGLKIDDGRYREIYFLPTIGYNSSDGGQLGLALYNSTFPGKRLKWALSPSYGFNTGGPVGEGWVSYDHYLKSETFRKLQYKLNVKTYSFQDSEVFEKPLRYVRISPHVSLHFQHTAQSQKYSKVYFKPIFINEERPIFSEDEVSISNRTSTLFRLGYERYNFWNLGPSEILANLEYQPYTNDVDQRHHYLKLTASYAKSFFYAPTRSVDFRVWSAYFISNSQRGSNNFDGTFARGTAALIHQGFNDYAYDDYFFNRANQNASLDNQIGYQGGGFKTPFGSQYSIGQTNDFAFSLNVKSNLPIKTPKIFPLKLFFDLGYYTANETAEAPLEGQSFYSGGVMLEYGSGLFSIYLPLVNSQVLNDIYENEGIGILGRISFRIDLLRFNPWDIAEDFSF